MPRSHSTIEDLRRVIDCLPTHTREAMLEGIGSNDIIVGAYSDRDGGICPMLAAHRCGGRTSFISFARAWDAFTGVKRARRATRRELRILETHLIASLAAERSSAGVPASDLGAAISAHQSLRGDRRREATGPALDFAGAIAEHQSATRARRGREAEQTGGWGFLRDRRDRQDAERALDRAERERARQEREPEFA